MFFFLFCIAVFLLLIILIIGGFVFVVGCIRRKDLPWLIEDELKKTPYGKYYASIAEADSWLKRHNAQPVCITSEDGLDLHGLWVASPNAKGTVLLAHGYRSTPLLDFGVAFPFYYSIGFNILVPSQRSHSESQGRFITFGVKESRDMYKWLEYHNHIAGDIPIILSGMSMGASTVLFLAEEELPDNVKGIIADCGFTSPKEILSAVFKRVTHLPPRPFIMATELYTRIFAGFSLKQKDTRQTLKHNRIPILLIHGLEDHFVPCVMSKESYLANAGPKDLLLIAGAGHGVSFLKAPEQYYDSVLNFIQDNVKGET